MVGTGGPVLGGGGAFAGFGESGANASMSSYISSNFSISFNPLQLSIAIQDQVLSGTGAASFALPANAFQHSDPSAQVSIEATLPDGSPLPPWINFDNQNQTFTVDLARATETGLQSIDIKVTGRDQQGNQASGLFRVNLNVLDPGAVQDGEGAAPIVPEDALPDEAAFLDGLFRTVDERQPEDGQSEGAQGLARQLAFLGRAGLDQARSQLLSDIGGLET